MIGNDIVDLTQAKQESNWQRKGFLNKLFTPYEQQLIQAADAPERMLWLLWSMKESAYKVSVRESGNRMFAPQKLACHIDLFREEMAEGVVFYKKAYSTKSIIAPQYVASVASHATILTHFHQEVILLGSPTHQHQSAMVREKIKQYATLTLAISEDAVSINKESNGAPELIVTGTLGRTKAIPISISHHGHYGAFAIDCTHGL